VHSKEENVNTHISELDKKSHLRIEVEDVNNHNINNNENDSENSYDGMCNSVLTVGLNE
jgi:hypothetical protein